MTVLGRSEEEAQLDTAKLFYPSMQVADIFELPVEIAYRRARPAARPRAGAGGRPPLRLAGPGSGPHAAHPLPQGERSDGRDDPGSVAKMSKSDPSSAIPSLRARPRSPSGSAGRSARRSRSTGTRSSRWPNTSCSRGTGAIEVERDPRHGGAVTFPDEASFLEAWRTGALHPMDLKNAVARSLARIVGPPSEELKGVPGADGQGL